MCVCCYWCCCCCCCLTVLSFQKCCPFFVSFRKCLSLSLSLSCSHSSNTLLMLFGQTNFMFDCFILTFAIQRDGKINYSHSGFTIIRMRQFKMSKKRTTTTTCATTYMCVGKCFRILTVYFNVMFMFSCVLLNTQSKYKANVKRWNDSLKKLLSFKHTLKKVEAE